MLHLDLFSGIGGFSLACEWAGIETIGFVENDKYCQKLLRKHWSDVPIVEDIRDVEKIKEIVAHAQTAVCKQSGHSRSGRTGFTDNNTADERARPTDLRSSAVLATAGFPCQPFSVAGKRGSYQDDRYLWPKTLAVIKAIKPRWILLENVAGIINLALDTVLSDLEGAGYSYETLVIPACAVNAPHRRDRVWIVANSISREGRSQGGWPTGRIENEGWGDTTEGRTAICSGSEVSLSGQPRQAGGIVAVTQRERLEGADTERDSRRTGCPAESGQRGRQADWWAVESELGRVAHGIPRRVDRLKCLGNAIVPQVAYEIIKAIAEIEDD